MKNGAASGNGQVTAEEVARVAWLIAQASENDPGQPFEEANLELLATFRKMAPAEFERVRAALKSVGVRVPELEKRIAALLGESRDGEADGLPGRRLEWPEDAPWPDPVDGASLLLDLAATLKRFVVMPGYVAETCALWVVAAHAFDHFDIFPRLGITSPTPECGKTTLLTMLGRLVPRPLIASNATGPAIFRAIDVARPVLLIDEADTFLPENNELRGILNSGHKREAAFVLRVVGEDHEPRQFGTWTPMVLAAIGDLPGTLASRCLRVRMERRLAGEPIDRLRRRDEATFTRLRRQIARWCADAGPALAVWDGDTSALMNRAADNWLPLVAVAELAGGAWPALTEAAATAKSDEDETAAVGVQMLADLLAVFDDARSTELPTKQLLAALHFMEERPWTAWGRSGKPITGHALGRLLKPFGIHSKTIRVGEVTPKGYERDPICRAYARYGDSGPVAVSHHDVAEDSGISKRNTATNEQYQDVSPDFKAQHSENVADWKRQKDEQNQPCGGVADRNPPTPLYAHERNGNMQESVADWPHPGEEGEDGEDALWHH